MKTSEFLLGAVALIVTTVAVVWLAHRVWYGGFVRRRRTPTKLQDDDPILWI